MFFMWLNPILLVVGLIVLVFLAHPISLRPASSPLTIGNEIQQEDDEDFPDEDDDGGIRVDLDAPLDLPPGVYVMPPELEPQFVA